ncbi:MAG TPA: allantoicase [Vicinamibacterales bacterium]|nr:allantoicase [Vicinamibacterales bacterium]
MSESFQDLVDLASERLGAAAIAANDDFFAPKENLIKAAAPIWIEGKYTDKGKWMDGWETRRRRDAEPGTPGVHDWCVIRLGAAGIVRGVDVHTAFFKGNYPDSCAIDLADLPDAASRDDVDRAAWKEALPQSKLAGDSHNLFTIGGASRATHLRLRIYPDGGVARLRVHGDVVVDWNRLERRGDVDLAAAEHGGFVVVCSDMFFGSRNNLILPGDSTHMGDGWETKRRRTAGHEWTIVRLARAGTIRRIEVDTKHFKGNAPGSCSLDAATLDERAAGTRRFEPSAVSWRELVPRTPLRPDALHSFEDGLPAIEGVTHVRLNIFPDGGIARLRLFGRPK